LRFLLLPFSRLHFSSSYHSSIVKVRYLLFTDQNPMSYYDIGSSDRQAIGSGLRRQRRRVKFSAICYLARSGC